MKKLHPTQLSHPTVAKNILKAMREAMKQGHSYVTNKKGHAFIRVEYGKERKGMFSFVDTNGFDCVFLVRNVLLSNGIKYGVNCIYYKLTDKLNTRFYRTDSQISANGFNEYYLN